MIDEGALHFERRRSLAEQVADSLVEGIGLGIIKAGQRIGEAEIAQQFRVSRVPVREAFKILATQGILDGEPNRGVRAAPLDEVAIGQICDARLAIEGLAIGSLHAVPDRLPELARVLDARIAEMARQVSAQDLVGVNRADIAFHTQICHLSGNRIVQTLWDAIARHVWIVFGREILSETSLSAIVRQHADLAEAITRGSLDQAAGELQSHVFRLRAGPHAATDVMPAQPTPA